MFAYVCVYLCSLGSSCKLIQLPLMVTYGDLCLALPGRATRLLARKGIGVGRENTTSDCMHSPATLVRESDSTTSSFSSQIASGEHLGYK